MRYESRESRTRGQTLQKLYLNKTGVNLDIAIYGFMHSSVTREPFRF